MQRALTTVLVLLALTGVASGDLLRPCDCHQGGESDAHARCRAPAGVSAVLDCCGCHLIGRGDDQPAEGEDEGCRICCKPRPPLGEAGVAAADAQPTPFVAFLDESWSAPSAPTCVTSLLEPVRRTSDPWLLSPEGLTVFLI